jgi:UDP-3-O-[3-hydroxymyristoyl] N-acetylglucosamine deacetylase
MDGLSFLPTAEAASLSIAGMQQRTLKTAIGCAGVGLHSGQSVNVRLVPAAPGTGIAFYRVDLGVTIPALYSSVVDTRLCTMIGLVADGRETEARVGTIEHLMAALSASGIDNLVIELDGAEVPVLDGSAEPWLFLIDCAGIAAQDAPRRAIEVLRTVRVEEGDAFAEVRPGNDGLELAMSIEFDARAIGRQALSLPLETECFRRDLSRARTFAMKHEIEGLQRMGLARGGSLDNAVVVDGACVLNPTGLRMQDEFVRHKMLDAVGDLALAGGPLQARFIGHKSGHALNNQVLRALFADSANWRLAGGVLTDAGILAAA